jgi:enamine deaminase RidA (YjgF/YER057c/UK114 family)
MMANRLFRIPALTALALVLAPGIWAGHKKNQEPKPQVLPLPKELPMALTADTASLSFRVTPLLRTGRLTAQIKDSLAYLLREAHGETIVKLRAFVAGAGDSRRVQELVGEMFTEKRLPLPVLTIVQVGDLGDTAAAVVLEAVVSGKRSINPNGLAFFASQDGPSLDAAVSKLQASIQAASLSAADVVSTTCFAARLTDVSAMRKTIEAAFPHTTLNLVQATRDPVDSSSACEAVARIGQERANRGPANLTNSRAFFLTSPQTVFTGMQLSFGTYLDDADSALARLQHDVTTVHANLREAAVIDAFSLSPAAASALRKTMPKFDVSRALLTIQPVEGLPSLDAALGVEVILAPTTPATSARVLPDSSATLN